jgi:hypothetical protein
METAVSVEEERLRLREGPLPLLEEQQLRAELSTLRVKELKNRARQVGVDEEKLADADDEPDVKGTVIELVLEGSALLGQARARLSTMKVKALKARAREVGVDDAKLDDADDEEDVKGTVISLILQNNPDGLGLSPRHEARNVEPAETKPEPTAKMDEQEVQALLSLMKKQYKTAKDHTASEKAEKKLLKKRYLAGKRFVDLGAERRGKLGKELVMQLIGVEIPRIDDPAQQAIAFTTMAGSATEVTLPGFLKWWDAEARSVTNGSQTLTSLGRTRSREPEPQPEQQPEQHPEQQPEQQPEPALQLQRTLSSPAVEEGQPPLDPRGGISPHGGSAVGLPTAAWARTMAEDPRLTQLKEEKAELKRKLQRVMERRMLVDEAEVHHRIGRWDAPGRVTVLCSAPEFSQSGDNVMNALFGLCKKHTKSLKFGCAHAAALTRFRMPISPFLVLCC